MSRRRLLFLLALVPQLLVLGTMIVRAETTLRDGVACDFEVAAFDPVDLLSGRHVVTRLAVQRVDRSLVAWTPDEIREGDVLFALVDPTVTPAQVIALTPFEPEPGTIFLRGEVTWVGDEILNLDYGLERFFIPADGVDPSTWWDADLGRRPELLLRVRLRDGAATTEELFVDGVPYAEWNEAHREG
ncbi:MAG: GDYXXLXY domain-containing protein [Planctomycetes bacterium]|nr:GDYXXLXY domain-containing protein [Planctomycetota bacterium]